MLKTKKNVFTIYYALIIILDGKKESLKKKCSGNKFIFIQKQKKKLN